MKKLASEALRDLQVRVANLEKKAGPGAGVEVHLSGDSREYRVLDTEIENNLSFNLDWHEVKDIKGKADIENVSVTSYYDAKHCRGLVGRILGTSVEFEEHISDMILDFLVEEEVFEKPKVLKNYIIITSLESTMVGGGYMRSSAPKEIEVQGEAEVLIEFETQDGEIVEFYESDLEFKAEMMTTAHFRNGYDALDSGEYEDEFEY